MERWAKRWSDTSTKGYDVYAYDVDCEKAKEAVESRATVTDTLERAVRPAEMIIIAVGTYEQAKSVVYDTGGILESATAGDVVAISSTLSPDSVFPSARTSETRRSSPSVHRRVGEKKRLDAEIYSYSSVATDQCTTRHVSSSSSLARQKTSSTSGQSVPDRLRKQRTMHYFGHQSLQIRKCFSSPRRTSSISTS
ncbi:hypothetical protein D8S78_22845 [Natrialba swarupiae]|nr:hypothetical protein [Natrialba swarupiae]